MKCKSSQLASVLGLSTALFASSPARADELEDLRREVDQTRADVAALRAEIAAREAEADRQTRARQQAEAQQAAREHQAELDQKAQAERAQERRQAQEPTLELYGYAQLDYIQDFQRVDPAWESTLRPTRIPTEPGQFGSDGQAVLSVRQSRLGVNAALPLGAVGSAFEDARAHQVRGVFEFDMFGVGVDAGQTTMRLRHAYGTWASLLAGQTNSLFMDGDMFPNFIDYWGPAGMALYRNPQIRFTPFQGVHTVAVALERSGTVIDSGTTGVAMLDDHPLPDLTAHYRWADDFGHLQFSGLARQLGYQGATLGSPRGTTLGWGAHVSSNLRVGGATLRLSAIYGHGVANYMNDAGPDLAPVSSTVFEAQPLLAFVAYWDHAWTRQLGTSLGYSGVVVTNQALQAPNAFHRGDYASVTVTVEPVSRVLLGASYLWGRRGDLDGASGTDNRLQFSARFSFTSAR